MILKNLYRVQKHDVLYKYASGKSAETGYIIGENASSDSRHLL